MEPRKLVDIAKECRRIYDDCAREDPDLFGFSVLDLMADNLSCVSLSDLKSAIIISGIWAHANQRIRTQIDRYGLGENMCDSGKYHEEVYDARGIYVGRVCEDCRERTLKVYRKDIFTDSNYEVDELLDED
jgi:hypothetical protein